MNAVRGSVLATRVAGVRVQRQAPARRAGSVRPAAVRVVMAAVEEELAAALKLAEECEDDCAVAWDTVEELSAAADDKKPPPEPTKTELKPEVKEFIQETRAALAEAQAAATISTDTLRMLDKAQAAIGNVPGDVKEVDPRLADLEKQIEVAIAAAKECTDDCATAWDEVEELSQTAADLKK
mmetsp:Transcript_3179/g.11519  ORF Transcript_3179/g.11519 Transcript_3179/m.11519 type:complete len:182 (+) Transcript_3179:67-612(+)|eukprot:CAMPEP_0170136894 /NCGR_PEP_ID=MMETSP0033_2-20121228/3723_1 /TAXON_ID=195969 /ORGANISM="Dolichomastix tenuilepis, Strain CCMP3274" /LENGTH=181 /DNA_ID=CAMNT_0010372697 /DNA_START=54 /DNA_END=599 /DNA_ORIENTATION=+